MSSKRAVQTVLNGRPTDSNRQLSLEVPAPEGLPPHGPHFLFTSDSLFGQTQRLKQRKRYFTGALLPDLSLLLRIFCGVRKVLEKAGTVYVPSSTFDASYPGVSIDRCTLPPWLSAHDLQSTDYELLRNNLKKLRDEQFFSTYAELRAMSAPEFLRRDNAINGRQNAARHYGRDPFAGISLTVLHPNEVNTFLWAVLHLIAISSKHWKAQHRIDDVAFVRAGIVWARWAFVCVFNQWANGERPVGWKLMNAGSMASLRYEEIHEHPLFAWDPWEQELAFQYGGRLNRTDCIEFAKELQETPKSEHLTVLSLSLSRACTASDIMLMEQNSRAAALLGELDVLLLGPVPVVTEEIPDNLLTCNDEDFAHIEKLLFDDMKEEDVQAMFCVE